MYVEDAFITQDENETLMHEVDRHRTRTETGKEGQGWGQGQGQEWDRRTTIGSGTG